MVVIFSALYEWYVIKQHLKRAVRFIAASHKYPHRKKYIEKHPSTKQTTINLNDSKATRLINNMNNNHNSTIIVGNVNQSVKVAEPRRI